MKICPSCNARASDDAASCPSCDHEFVSRRPKKTMMGIPTMGDDEEAPSDDDARTQVAKSTQFGMPAIKKDDDSEAQDKRTEVVSSEQLPFSDVDLEGDQPGEESEASTQQVDSSAVAAALGRAMGDDANATAFGVPTAGSEEGDEEDAVAAAWGLDEPTAAEKDTATQIVSASEIDFSGTAGDASYSGAPQKDDDEIKDGPSTAEFGRGSGFGTLMGMSLDEQSGDESAAGGAMQRGFSTEPDDEADSQDGATQALSPDQLAQIDDMDFGDSFDEGSSSERIQVEGELQEPKQELTPGRDSQPTPVASDAGMGGGMKFPKPSDSTEDESDADEPEQRPKSNTSPSGVLRAARVKRKTGNLSDSGVTGTGTYRRGKGRTGTSSDSDVKESERNLKLGAVGGKGKTSFPAGSSSREKVREAAKGSASEEQAAPSTDGDDLMDGMSLDDISMSWDDQTSDGDSGDAVAEQSASALGEMASPDQAVSDANKSGKAEPLKARLKRRIKETKSTQEEPEPVDVEPQPVDVEPEPVDVEPEPVDVEPQPLDVEPEPVDVEPQPVDVEPQPVDVEPQPVDLEPEPVDVEPAAATEAPSQEPIEVAEKPATPQQPPSARPQNKGSEDVAVNVPEVAPHSEQPSFGAEPASQVSAEQHVATNAESADDSEDSSERVLTLIQKGFGLLSGVVMIAISMVAVVLDGMPEQTVDMGLMAVPMVLGLAVMGLSMISLSTKIQSAIYAVIGMLALLGFGMGFAIEMNEIMIIAMFCGALLLFCSAAFPVVGRKMMAGA